MFNHTTRPVHFFVPLVMILIGGFVAQFPNWSWVGYLIALLAVYVAHWLYRMGIEQEKTERIRENNAFYESLERLDDEKRAAMGLEPAKSTTKIIIDKSSLVGDFFSQAYREAPIPPWKLKQFAKGIKAGKAFHIREWTPLKDNKLFSDPEWRDLIAFLKRPDPELPALRFITQRHPTNERKGFDWTTEGQQWLDDVLYTETALLPNGA